MSGNADVARAIAEGFCIACGRRDHATTQPCPNGDILAYAYWGVKEGIDAGLHWAEEMRALHRDGQVEIDPHAVIPKKEMPHA